MMWKYPIYVWMLSIMLKIDWWLLAYLYLAYNAMEPCKLFCNCTFNWVIKSEVNGVTHTLVHQVKLVNRTRKTQFLAWFNASMTLLSQKMKKENYQCVLLLHQAALTSVFSQPPTDPSPPKSTNYPLITKAKIGPKTKVHISQ